MADTENQNTESQQSQASETTESTQTQEREYTEIEQRAMAQGWVPQDQYQGTGKWRDAEEFIDRGELFSKIDEQGRRLKSQEHTLEALKKHYQTVRETEFKRALKALRDEKVAALENGDIARSEEIAERIEETRLEKQKLDAQDAVVNTPRTVQPDPALNVWIARNTWYNTDPVMKAAADVVGQQLALSGIQDPIKILTEVESRIKKEFPHKFRNPNRDKPNAVEGGTSKGTTKNDNFQLTSEETRAMNKFVSAGVLTKEQYIADIKATRGA